MITSKQALANRRALAPWIVGFVGWLLALNFWPQPYKVGATYLDVITAFGAAIFLAVCLLPVRADAIAGVQWAALGSKCFLIAVLGISVFTGMIATLSEATRYHHMAVHSVGLISANFGAFLGVVVGLLLSEAADIGTRAQHLP